MFQVRQGILARKMLRSLGSRAFLDGSAHGGTMSHASSVYSSCYCYVLQKCEADMYTPWANIHRICDVRSQGMVLAASLQSQYAQNLQVHGVTFELCKLREPVRHAL